MEMFDYLPAIAKTLMGISLGGLFLAMLFFVDKIKLIRAGKRRPQYRYHPGC